MEGCFRVSKQLSFFFSKELGHGPRSTVFEGRFEDIPVAVKRVQCADKYDAEKSLRDFKTSREKFVMNEIERDRQCNVVGYYTSVRDGRYMYFALELCDGHLGDYVRRHELSLTYPTEKVNRDIASGVNFLHSKNIAHRDLKPENIYFVIRRNVIHKFVIGDFGTSKSTVDDYFSISGVVGTFGYIAREVWKELVDTEAQDIRSKMSIKADIFALGCIFFYTVSHGQHPFGTIDKQNKIFQGKAPDLHLVDGRRYCLRVLLEKMLDHDPEKRPESTEILEHPALWTAGSIMKYLKETNDDLQVLSRDGEGKENYIENMDVIWDGKWTLNMPQKLKVFLETFHEEKFRDRLERVVGVMWLINYVMTNYRSFPAEVREELGTFPDGHVNMWLKLCPHLLMHVYEKTNEFREKQRTKSSDVPHTEDVQQTETSSEDGGVDIKSDRDDNKEATVEGEERDSPLFGQATQDETRTSLSPTPSVQVPEVRIESIPDDAVGEGGEEEETGIQFVNDFTEDLDETDSIATDVGDVSLQEGSTHKTDSIANDVGCVSLPEGSTHKTDRLPEIIKQTQAFSVPDASMWRTAADKELTEARSSGLGDTAGDHVVLCIDVSESMARGGAWGQTTRFVNDFIQCANSVRLFLDQKDDYVSVVSFGHETKVIQRLTRDTDLVRNTFDKIRLGGPSPMYGGIMLSAASAQTPHRSSSRSKPRLVIVSDCRLTDTCLFNGPDVQNENSLDETKAKLVEVIVQHKEAFEFIFVPVGHYDKDFINLVSTVTGRPPLQFDQARKLFKTDHHGDQDVYHERFTASLPEIGSRVRRGPDWMWGDQDGSSPGTIIGHDATGASVWVEWDVAGHQNVYRYGHENCYDVLLDDTARSATPYGRLAVGCLVVQGSEAKTKIKQTGEERIGAVIKVLGERVLVRWKDGGRSECRFGEDNIYDVWPWSPGQVKPL